MKLYKTLMAALAVAAVTAPLTSCDDDFDRPPVIVPVATYEVNMAIADFKEMFWSYAQDNKYTVIPCNQEGDSIILGGRITSTDIDGNIYQQVIVEDESGAINFGVNMYDINQKYQYGQEVRINVTGMLVGGYGHLMQIGGLYNGSLGRMDEAVFTTHAQVNGLPDRAAAEALVMDVTIDDLVAKKADQAALRQLQSRFVRFTGVHFEGGGKLAWSDAPTQTGYTARNLLNADGVALAFRTSNKCTFAADILPTGTGTVVALLGYYNNDWQLAMSNPATDCYDFDGVPVGNLFEALFTDGMNGFTIENVKALPDGKEVWVQDAKYGMKATAFISSVNYEADAWLISPVIDLAGLDKASLKFDHAINYFTSVDVAKTEATVSIREAGSTAWTLLTIPEWPTNSDWTFVSTGAIDLSAWAGKKVQIGLRYTSTAAKAGTWEVKNLTVSR